MPTAGVRVHHAPRAQEQLIWLRLVCRQAPGTEWLELTDEHSEGEILLCCVNNTLVWSRVTTTQAMNTLLILIAHTMEVMMFALERSSILCNEANKECIDNSMICVMQGNARF
jgi:hypothetical protein